MSEEATYLNEDGVARLNRLVSYFEDSESATVEARELAERDRRYYDNFNDGQWTDDEKEILKQRKQPVTTSNRIKPKINYMLGEEAKRRSLPKAYPRTPQDADSAGAATDGLRFVIDDNRYENTRSAVFKNMCIEGYGGVEIRAEKLPMKAPTAQADYKIVIVPLKWDRLFYDQHSREVDFSDAKYRGQVIWLDQDDAKEEYPDADEVFAKTWASDSGTSTTYDDAPRIRWTDAKRKRVRIAEVWHKEGGVWYHCVYTKGGILSEMESPYKDEDGNTMPGILLQSCFVDQDGNRYGVARDWISVQDEINKRRSKALHLNSVRQTKGEKGAVEDVRRMKQELAKPDGHVEVTPGMEFDVLPTGDMAQAQFALLSEAKQEIDSLGVNAQMSGSDDRNMSGRALMKREESGLAELGPVFDMLSMLDHAVYRHLWCLIKQFWTAEKWIRITDDEDAPKFVGFNQQMTRGQQLLEEAQKKGVPITPEMQAQANSDPQMQQVIIKNNVAEMDVDIVIDTGPASATIQAEQFAELADLAKVRGDIPTVSLIEASGLRNKDKLLKAMGKGDEDPQVSQLKQEMQQMGGVLEQMQAELEQAKIDRSIEMKKMQIDEYNAETNRLKVTSTSMTPEQMQQIVMQTISDVFGGQMPMQEGQPTEAPEMEKAQREAELKLEMQAREHVQQVKIEGMRLRAKNAEANTDPMLEIDEEFNAKPNNAALDGINALMAGVGQLAQGISDLQQIMLAPKELIRDESGRAVGSRVVLQQGGE